MSEQAKQAPQKFDREYHQGELEKTLQEILSENSVELKNAGIQEIRLFGSLVGGGLDQSPEINLMVLHRRAESYADQLQMMQAIMDILKQSFGTEMPNARFVVRSDGQPIPQLIGNQWLVTVTQLAVTAEHEAKEIAGEHYKSLLS